MRPEISIILPCYRAADVARRSVAELQAHLGNWNRTWEVIVVDDGGGDFEDLSWADGRHVRILQLPINRGKGAAVTAGMLAARGTVRIFTDVDLPYGPHLFPIISEYIWTRGFHLVIGDRTLPGSAYAHRISIGRRVASGAFSGFVGRLVTGGFFDTQCGLKAFRGDVAESLFPLLRLHRFTFDVELIYLSLRHKLDIKRIPVQLQRNTTSSVRLWRDSCQALMDVCRIKYHQIAGHYRSTGLEEIVTRDFADASWQQGRRMEPVTLLSTDPPQPLA